MNIDYIQIAKNWITSIINEPGWAFSCNLPWSVEANEDSITIKYEIYMRLLEQSIEDLKEQIEHHMDVFLNDTKVTHSQLQNGPSDVTLVFKSTRSEADLAEEAFYDRS